MKVIFILQLFGIRLEISKVSQNNNILEMDRAPQNKKAAQKMAGSDCEVCQGETEIRLAGSAQKMPCPKCKGKARASQLLS